MDSLKILQELGRGTYGRVMLCERKHNKQKIVVKEMYTDTEGDQIVLAKNEVSILKSLHHPNVIQYYDSFVSNKMFYILMEFANKGNLYQYIAQHKSEYITPKAVLNYFCQILMGLNHIHSKNIIHRDLKSENIFLTGSQADVIKIGDFGISKILQNSGKTNTVIGTANYIAPEMCDEQSYDVKSDIWALGCILYELCALERMFEGTMTNIVMSIKSGKIRQIDVMRYGYEMQQIIDATMQLNPADRPDTFKLMSFPQVFPALNMLGANLGCIGI